MIALRKEDFNLLAKKFNVIGIFGVLVMLIAIFKIIFYKEGIINIIKLALSFYFIFVLPGFSLMLYFNKYNFFERLIIGIPLSAALVGILSYYLGILGVHIKYLTYFLPSVIILIGIFMHFKSDKSEGKANNNQ